MTIDGERFITEMLRAMRGDMSDIKDRMINLELRQSAMEQRLLGIDTHLTTLQHGVDGLSSDMRRVKQRLELVDGEA